ncbi:MAG TPA: aminotransferase class V-fold PLP-dependent enzyme [Thermoanaerobaculia bacterium]
MPVDDPLHAAGELARRYLASLAERPVGARLDFDALRARLGALPAAGVDAVRVVEELAAAVDPGLVASAGPRFFGFVIGGSVPAALAADWLASAWDQNAALATASPAAAAVESVARDWLLDLFDLPRSTSLGLVTGGQMANFTCLAAARHAVLERAGWDVETRGLQGAPRVEVIVGDEAHATVFSALRYLGLGSGGARRVAVDAQGRMRPEELARALAGGDGPAIVCAQAGNVDTGAFDPLDEIAPLARAKGAWLHVDGAFGLWAAASPARRALLCGFEAADSWSTDAHKWLNVPYDCGIAMVADAASHRGAMGKSAAYLLRAGDGARDSHDFTPESSRRARGFAVYAALRSLGRAGVADLVERCCRLAARCADRLRRSPGVRVLNDVVLNQVLVRFEPPGGGDADAFTRAVVERVQADGTCWLGGTRWQGQDAMRISVSGWSTTEADIDRSADAILACTAGSW